MLEYLLKSNIALVILYGLYRLWFKRDTFFTLRRYTLLFIVVAAVVCPLVDLSAWVAQSPVLREIGESYTALLPEVIVRGERLISIPAVDWFRVALLGYLFSIAVLAARLLFCIAQVVRLKSKSEPMVWRKTRLHRLEAHEMPFSFFRWIFLNPSLHTDAELDEIVEHERAHVDGFHSLDTLLAQLLLVFYWFNPAAWLLASEIGKNLEFEADRRVVNKGFHAKAYQFHLLRLSQQPKAMAICNHISLSPLKERIIMLNKKKTHPLKRGAYALLLPVFLLFALAYSACTTKTEQAPAPAVEEVQTKQVETPPATPPAPEEQVFTVVEVMPKYPGGDNALLKDISQGVKYPIESQEKGIQGRVICSFVVKADGNYSDIAVVRGVDPLLDAEAIRVIKTLKNFEPGMQRGKKVAVKYTLPVTFRLQ